MSIESIKCTECNGKAGYLSVPFERKDATVYICALCYIEIIKEYEESVQQHNHEINL